MERLLNSASETTGVLSHIWVGPNSNYVRLTKRSASETGHRKFFERITFERKERNRKLFFPEFSLSYGNTFERLRELNQRSVVFSPRTRAEKREIINET